MNTIPFVPGCTWVNLYINGDYRGLYMVTEQIEVANDRVEVDDSGSSPDKGYLVEFDTRGQSETGAVEGLTYFYIPGFYDTNINLPREWVIKSNVTSRAENKFIKDYFVKCHKAIMSGKRANIDALVDIPSLIDMFIIEELTKDVDVGAASNFWQKDKGGKLYFTAPWDFDLSIGNDELVDNGDYRYIYVGKSGILGLTHHEWYIKLYSCQWFLDLVKLRWSELSNTVIVDLIKEVEEKSKDLMPSLMSNYALWTPVPKKIGREPIHVYTLNGAKAHTDFLINWLNNRKNWLDEHWKI
jgi:hypothetical protein